MSSPEDHYPKYGMIRICRNCSDPLREGNNWYPSAKRSGDYICKTCHKSKVRSSQLGSERFREIQRVWQRTKRKPRVRSLKAREANKLAVSRYREKYPERLLAATAFRRAKRLNARLSPDYDEGKIIELYAMAKWLTVKFGVPYHVDHVFPLALGGLHHHSNMVVMRGDFNLRKGAKLAPFLIGFFCPS